MQTYSREMVADALGRRGSDIDALLYSFRLTLASEAPGRLVAREFPLIDVYTIGLAFELIDLSGRRDQACRAIEHFMWWQHLDSEDIIREHHGKPKMTAAERIEGRKALAAKYAADPGAAGECFKRHELQWPWFLVGHMREGKIRLRAYDDHGLWPTGVRGERALFVVNATALVREIDEALMKLSEAA